MKKYFVVVCICDDTNEIGSKKLDLVSFPPFAVINKTIRKLYF